MESFQQWGLPLLAGLSTMLLTAILTLLILTAPAFAG